MKRAFDGFDYARWLLRSATKHSAVGYAVAIAMMLGGYGMATQAAFGSHKTQNKLPWAIAALVLSAPALAVYRHAEERADWVKDGRSILRWSRAQWQEKLLEVPKDEELKALVSVPVTAEDVRFLTFQQLIHFPAMLLYGAQGSGKTTLAKAIGQARASAGHQVKVLDPHGDPAEWEPWKLVGAGMEYEAIQGELLDFQGAIERDYKAFAKGKRDFPHQTLIADEFTNWSGRLNSEVAIAFLKTCLTDIRKVGKHAIFVSHANTLEAGLAGAGGLAKLRDSGMVQLELFSEPRSDGKAHPTGYGSLKIPGKPAELVRIPNLSAPLQLPAAKLTPELESVVDDAIADVPTDPRKQLENLFNSEDGFNPAELRDKEKDELINEKRSDRKLSKPAQAILNKYQEKEMYGTWIDAKWVKNYAFRSKDLSNFSPEQIRGFLIELAASSVGSVEGEGAGLRWYYDPIE
ncbi:MAG: ATP-binding protein [Cyanobacteria bacterium CRU_2_1]|nr:ATP-binding protein [Cyanobacteria bacterium CRU_2_1]